MIDGADRPRVTRGLAAASLAMLAALMTALTLTPADAYPPDVIRKCKGDYRRLCPTYKLHTQELRSCMRSQHRSISNICMNALVDAGEAPMSARRK
jgi:hypothetical protein